MTLANPSIRGYPSNAMLREDVVAYLRAHYKKFPEEQLRHQLANDGVTDAEFDLAMAEVKKPAPAPTAVKANRSLKLARALMILGGITVVFAGVMAIAQRPRQKADDPSLTTGDSGFIGHFGYVVRLPPGYQAVQSRDERKNLEVVYFCKAGTDPTTFLDEGLFGQLGIVRLEVQPSPVPNDLHGLENLTKFVTGRAASRGEKHTLKNLQFSTLRGIQLNYDVPFPRVEAFILGREVMYTFTAGQDDETYRGLLQSLRDSRSEI